MPELTPASYALFYGPLLMLAGLAYPALLLVLSLLLPDYPPTRKADR